MLSYLNISGELVKQLVYPTGNKSYPVGNISFTNVQKVSKCKVDLYIEKLAEGKFYLLKGVELPIGATLIYDCMKFKNQVNEYGLFVKLTDGDSFDITGSINPDGANPADGTNTVFLSEISVGDELVVNSEVRTVSALVSDTALTMSSAFSNGNADTTVQCNPTALVDVIIN
tara:strand:- start:1231 stop:1746 length:516 start_codon:yes stop_codon:yes gene_type:complete